LTSKFFSMDEEKQQRILNAAISQFAHKGYEQASTNEIVKKAGISKGLLFHYFKNKKELYLFLHQHFTKVLMNEFFAELPLENRDIFVRLRSLMLLKSRLMQKYPGIFQFLISTHVESSPEVKDEMDTAHLELLQRSYAKIFNNIDTAKFKEGTDIKRAINIILWTLEGYSNSVLATVKHLNQGSSDFSAEFAEGDSYIEMLKNTFYK
jgi:TetR/AcrR family transcriptional regulator